ncbi:hypothetical protein COOONC_01222 [Cooperia oncophora]
MSYQTHPLHSSFSLQNVNHSGLGGSGSGQQGHTNGNWDCINLGNAHSQQNHYGWSEHAAAHTDANRTTASNYVDPYSAAVMGAYQQGTQNVVYPYQQRGASSENYAQSTTSQGGMPQHVAVDQNYYYHQQNSQQQLQQSQTQNQSHTKPSAAQSVQPVASQHVHHTLVSTRQHVQQSSHQSKPVEVYRLTY